MAIQIADAVADAHAAGFVHGGLSPDSVVITARGHAKIPAFELAAHGGFEQTDGQMRLRDYDSPEEARGGAPDDRSDIYSIGAILYEMLTSRRPLHRGASAPSAANSHVPKELDEVMLKAIAPNPESRYQSAATLAAELRGDGRPRRCPRRRGRRGRSAGRALDEHRTRDGHGAADPRGPCGCRLVVHALVRISPRRSANADRAST